MGQDAREPKAGAELLSRRRLLLGRAADAPREDVASVGSACFMARGIACRLCEDTCDTGAFRFRPLLGGRAEVTVEESRCTACGDCLDICPAGAIALTAASRPAEPAHAPAEGGHG
ncbi:4Fe-4S dicluster domain-containing protein [Pelagibius sp.]|uniref:4Fe-4S dicluster domain-containing protein n=1 Tax=Pelagibius sp. TaxID=1931238 RepID=UPI00261632A9|nr:4Fe-4S dicluster domain-containing protein [Pelagibius sp.]